MVRDPFAEWGLEHAGGTPGPGRTAAFKVEFHWPPLPTERVALKKIYEGMAGSPHGSGGVRVVAWRCVELVGGWLYTHRELGARRSRALGLELS